MIVVNAYMLLIPNKTRGINIHVKSREANLADFKISLLFSDGCKLKQAIIKTPH